jgi:hypothetical protein
MTKELLTESVTPLSVFASRVPLLPEAKIIFQFEKLPSINEYLAACKRDRHIGGKFEKYWRTIGHTSAENWILQHHGKRRGGYLNRVSARRRADGSMGVRLDDVLVEMGAYIEWRIWKTGFQVKDSCFNLYTKAVEDGFTDVGIWPNDDDRYIVGRNVVLCGVGKHSRIECHVHNLDNCEATSLRARLLSGYQPQETAQELARQLDEPHQHTGPRSHHER